MNVSASVSVRKNSISRTVRGVKSAVDTATWRTARMMLEEMRARVRHGASRRSDGVSLDESLQVLGSEGDATIQVGSVGAHGGRPVARYIEMGTHHNRAYPFARPAAARGRKMLKQEAEADVKRAADSA